MIPIPDNDLATSVDRGRDRRTSQAGRGKAKGTSFPTMTSSSSSCDSAVVFQASASAVERTLAKPPPAKVHSTPVLLLIIALASVATLLCYRAFLNKYDRSLHSAVQESLKELFPDATIRLGHVAADGSDKIVINNVRFACLSQRNMRDVMIIHRVVLHGDLDIANWAQNTIRVSQVDLHGVRFDVWPRADGSFSIQAIKPTPVPNAITPAFKFADGSLRLFSDASPSAKLISVHDINARITPLLGQSRSVAVAGNTKPPMQIEAVCRSPGLVKQIDINGRFDPGSQSWQLGGSVQELNFSPKLLDLLPSQLSQYLMQLSGLECQASSLFKISADPVQRVQFEVQGRISSGRLQDPRLPYQLEELSSDFFCNNQMLQLRSTHATSGGAELQLSSDILGFGRDVPMIIHAQATNLELDSRLRSSLPRNLQEQWDRLQPAGRVSGNIELAFDGSHWKPRASIRCQDVSLKPWLFPYPLTNVQGLVHYHEGTISSERLDGLASGQPAHSSFRLTRLGHEWFGQISGRSEGPLAIDEQLISALTPRDKSTSDAETFVRSLNPSGTIELRKIEFERASANDPVWHRSIEAFVAGGSIHYDRFRYPIYDIHGRIAGQDENWWLHQFEGHNDSGQIFCSGNWVTGREGGLPFNLRFEAAAVPIEDELKHALPVEAQAIWDELQPSGSIDVVHVELGRRAGQEISTRVVIGEESESNASSGRSLRILPKSFPIWLSDLDCHIEYQPGQVIIHHASGVNGDSRLSVRGDCRPRSDGRWLADVQWQPRTRLIVDAQLLRALPKSMRDSLERIDFRGPVSILGRSQLLFANNASTQLETAWDCQLDVENGQLGDGRSIRGLRGTVWATGASDGTNLNSRGSIAMDSLAVHGLPITDLRGPYAVLDNTLYFGSRVYEELGRDAAPPPPVEMTADALTGKLSLTGLGRLDSGKFIVDASLREAELSTLLRDVGVDRASTQAQCNAHVQFSGIPWNSQTWNGDGDIQLADAKLFQLPFMIRLLRTASVNANDDSAFQTADIHFDIDGDRIPLQIKCEGDVLRLRGEGWTNLRKEVDLQLYSYVGRRPIYSIVSPLLTESRYATFMMIEVTGTLDNPVMQRRPFPQLEATLQQIFPEVAERNSIQNIMPWQH